MSWFTSSPYIGLFLCTHYESVRPPWLGLQGALAQFAANQTRNTKANPISFRQVLRVILRTLDNTRDQRLDVPFEGRIIMVKCLAYRDKCIVFLRALQFRRIDQDSIQIIILDCILCTRCANHFWSICYLYTSKDIINITKLIVRMEKKIQSRVDNLSKV